MHAVSSVYLGLACPVLARPVLTHLQERTWVTVRGYRGCGLAVGGLAGAIARRSWLTDLRWDRPMAEADAAATQANELLEVVLLEGDAPHVSFGAPALHHLDTRVRLRRVDSVAAAVDGIERGTVDAVLIDVSTPELGGLRAVRSVQAAAPQVPLLILADGGTQHLGHQALAIGAQDHLDVTATESEVVRAIVHAVERQRLRSEREQITALLRRRAEQLMAANASLTAAADARDELLAVVSHELRTPLTPILGFAELLRERLGEELSPHDEVMLQAIERNTRRMEAQVDQLLRVTRLATEVQDAPRTPPREVLGLGELVVQLVEDELPRSEVTIDIPPGTTVHVHRQHLEQMLANLLVNARKYGRPPIEVEARSDGELTTIVVSDHGDGVPESFEPHLFERFRQASTGTRRTATGVGLGLYLVRQLALLHGGELSYHPRTAGPGACFSLRLPAQVGDMRRARPTGIAGGGTAQAPEGRAHADVEVTRPAVAVIPPASTSYVIASAARRFLHAQDAAEIARTVEDVVRALGGVVLPIDRTDETALPIDVSLGLGGPLLPVARESSTRAQLEAALPALLEDARAALAGLRARRSLEAAGG